MKGRLLVPKDTATRCRIRKPLMASLWLSTKDKQLVVAASEVEPKFRNLSITISQDFSN